jgi:hypothetical protein
MPHGISQWALAMEVDKNPASRPSGTTRTVLFMVIPPILA